MNVCYVAENKVNEKQTLTLPFKLGNQKWSVENQMDQVHINGRDIHNDNPAERLSYHGVLNDTENRYKGLNYGYPSCVPAWDPENVGIDGLLVGSLFKPDGVPEIPDGECANRMTGRLHFPAHTAPLDIKFNSNGTAAYIAFHGSWFVFTFPFHRIVLTVSPQRQSSPSFSPSSPSPLPDILSLYTRGEINES